MSLLKIVKTSSVKKKSVKKCTNNGREKELKSNNWKVNLSNKSSIRVKSVFLQINFTKKVKIFLKKNSLSNKNYSIKFIPLKQEILKSQKNKKMNFMKDYLSSTKKKHNLD